MPETFYITTPIYYVNDRPHIGHVYTTTIADIIARYHRLRGDDVFFLTGTDEHAAKVVDAAAQRNITTQEWADRNANAFETTFKRLGIANNDFIRTSQERHKSRVAEYVKALLDCGDVYLGDYEGWYDAGQEEYVPESKAKENDYKSVISGRPLVRKKEKNYFFKLSAWRDPLLQLLSGEAVDGQKFDVQPTARRNEIIERIKTAEDIPISRDVAGAGLGDWCIKVPGDDTHAIYVWIDALFNYVSTVDTPERRHYWQSHATHMIAKDILWFHAAIWPALLLSLRRCAGHEWVDLPRLVYSHSFWIAEGKKMSKSEGNFIDLEKIDHYVSTFSLDALRWFLATQGPMGTTDSDFAESRFIEVYNSELANTIGNCLSRILNMTNRYFDGALPGAGPRVETQVNYDEAAERCTSALTDGLDRIQPAAAGAAALDLVRAIDGYIEETKPFTLAKDEANKPKVGTILYNCAEAMRIASLLLWPFMPTKAEEIWRRLGCDYANQMQQSSGRGRLVEWAKWGQLKPGTPIAMGDALFPRYQVK